jgi:hypothetical protein
VGSQLRFGGAGKKQTKADEMMLEKKNGESERINEVKLEGEKKSGPTAVESNFHPLLAEPSEILFLRLRLLFFLKYSFFFNTETVCPLFFGRNGEGEVPRVQEVEKSKTNPLEELKNVESKKTQINNSESMRLFDDKSRLPSIGEEEGGRSKNQDSETKEKKVNLDVGKVFDKSVVTINNTSVMENLGSSNSGDTLSSFMNRLPPPSSHTNPSNNTDVTLATLLAPLLFYHPYEFVEEKIVLLSKMRRHYQALALLIGVVGDLQAAENYVVAFYSGEKKMRSVSSAYDTTHIEDRRLNDERYLHNTMILLMIRFNKTMHIPQYLCKFYRFLSLPLILDIIPLELPLSTVEPFLSLVFRSLAIRCMNSEICFSLLKAETLLKEVSPIFFFYVLFFFFFLQERLSAERSRNVEVNKNSRCASCGGLFGTSCYHPTGAISVATSRVYNALLNNSSDIIGRNPKSPLPSVYDLDESLINEDGSMKFKEYELTKQNSSQHPQTWSVVLTNPLAIAPNTTAYHTSCYHQILHERRSKFHPFRRPLGISVGGLASSGLISEKKKGTVSVKEFFGILKSTKSSVNRETTPVPSNAFTAHPEASPRSVFLAESVRRIEEHNLPIIPVLPSLSSVFASTDNSFATLLHNAASLMPAKNNPHGYDFTEVNDGIGDEYNLTTYLDEPIVASGLKPTYPQHMPVTYVITPGDDRGMVPRGGSRNNVVSVGAITSSLPFTEDSDLMVEQQKLFEIMRISGKEISMKEVCYIYIYIYIFFGF